MSEEQIQGSIPAPAEQWGAIWRERALDAEQQLEAMRPVFKLAYLWSDAEGVHDLDASMRLAELAEAIDKVGESAMGMALDMPLMIQCPRCGAPYVATQEGQVGNSFDTESIPDRHYFACGHSVYEGGGPDGRRWIEVDLSLAPECEAARDA
jgi:hypothetical protein